MAIFRNRKEAQPDSASDYGLIIDWGFHEQGRWVSAFAPYLVEAIIKTFSPVIIDSQERYDDFKHRVKYIIAMEPGWAAPKIVYDKGLNHAVAVMASDPHNKTDWFQQYILDNNITWVLSQYLHPFFFHFPDFPTERFVHFPWAVPDQFLSDHKLSVRNRDVAIFGAQAGPAYDVRNLCSSHPEVTTYAFSGVENKRLSNKEYYLWLRKFDAVVAAGSSDPVYDLVTPKYMEISSAGALLIGQYCKDLDTLGFNESNALVFDRDNFNRSIEAYKACPQDYLTVREKGRSLINSQHLMSHRIECLKKLFV